MNSQQAREQRTALQQDLWHVERRLRRTGNGIERAMLQTKLRLRIGTINRLTEIVDAGR